MSARAASDLDQEDFLFAPMDQRCYAHRTRGVRVQAHGKD